MHESHALVLTLAALLTGGCARPDWRGPVAKLAGAPTYRPPSSPRGTPDVGVAVALVARNGSSAGAHYKLGLAYYQTASYREAAAEMRTASRRSPDRADPNAYFYLGYSLTAAGNVQEARDTFRQLTQRKLTAHQAAVAYRCPGNRCDDLDDVSGAERAYHESLRHDPVLLVGITGTR